MLRTIFKTTVRGRNGTILAVRELPEGAVAVSRLLGLVSNRLVLPRENKMRGRSVSVVAEGRWVEVQANCDFLSRGAKSASFENPEGSIGSAREKTREQSKSAATRSGDGRSFLAIGNNRGNRTTATQTIRRDIAPDRRS
jgi:hypothetical protein